MSETLYIISDLHLGGAPPTPEAPVGFQLCPPAARARLVALLEHIRREHADPGSAHLVINGDFVDFLAEPEREVDGALRTDASGKPAFTAFSSDPIQAEVRFGWAVRNAEAELPDACRFFQALAEYVQAGYALTVLVGNHDLELTLPSVRSALDRLLTRGRPARLQWLLDGEALVTGPVLVEHGNRYDPWNWVDHGTLRRIRAQLSRGEMPGGFTPPAGSRLVQRVMNPLKERFRFIDVLKPETEVVLPVLAALDPAVAIAAGVAMPLAAEKMTAELGLPRGRPPRASVMVSRRVETAPGGDGASDGFEGAEPGTGPDLLLAAIERERARWPVSRSATEVSSGAAGLGARLGEQLDASRLAALGEALRGLQGVERAMFQVNREQEPWLSQARRLSAGGRLVVFGHTHVAKDVAFPETGGRYLNTGTWCPVMRLPPAIWSGSEDERRSTLARFVDDLRANRLENWCALRPTFVAVRTERGNVTDAGVFEMTHSGPRRIGPEEVFPPAGQAGAPHGAPNG